MVPAMYMNSTLLCSSALGAFEFISRNGHGRVDPYRMVLNCG